MVINNYVQQPKINSMKFFIYASHAIERISSVTACEQEISDLVFVLCTLIFQICAPSL